MNAGEIVTNALDSVPGAPVLVEATGGGGRLLTAGPERIYIGDVDAACLVVVSSGEDHLYTVTVPADEAQAIIARWAAFRAAER